MTVRADLRAMPPTGNCRKIPANAAARREPPDTHTARVSGGRHGLTRRLVALAALGLCCALLVPSIVQGEDQ